MDRPPAFAADDDEYVEVTAPNESGLPGDLGMLTGWGGASGMASLGKKALEYAFGRSATQKNDRKKDPNKKDQKSQYDEQTTESAGAAAAHEAGATVRSLWAPGVWKTSSTTKFDPVTGNAIEVTNTQECKPSGPLSSKNPCSKQEVVEFIDPTDGEMKWAYTSSVVQAVYNPKHIEADASGYALVTVGRQSFTLIFVTIEDLEYQLIQVSKAK